MVRAAAAQQNITEDEARAQLYQIAQIREEYAAKLEGSGMVVSDVRFDPVRQQIEVIVKPIIIEGEPAGWSPVARERLGVVRAGLERDLQAKGRQRVAQVELGYALGAPKTGLCMLIGAGGAPGLVEEAVRPAPAVVVSEG
jgi:hypothetical protein